MKLYALERDSSPLASFEGSTVEYRELGATGLRVSTICFGGGQLGDYRQHGLSERDALKTVHHALDKGVTFFDTSFWYGHGEGERLLGKGLGSRRRDVHIATKVGLHLFNGKGIRDSRRERIIGHIDSALRRLGTDYVDLYQIHWPDPLVPFEDSWEAMCRVRDSGKARFIGVSNYWSDQIERCLSVGPVHSLQSCFHMFRRELENREFAFCRDRRIGVMVWGPLAHGLLSGRYNGSNPPRLSENDWRAAMPIMRPQGFAMCTPVIECLSGFAAERGHTLIELAVAWTLNRLGITTLITGCRTPAHLDSQLGGVSWHLSAEEDAYVSDVLKASRAGWEALGGDPEYGGHHVIPLGDRPNIGVVDAD